jgi:hypothetical protein
MPRDYTDAPSPLIPDDTVATVNMHVLAGGVGEDGMCKRSTNGECEMLHGEFTVLDGPYKDRKFWQHLIVEGTTDGQKQAADRTTRTLKAILDSALGLKPKDESKEARAARTVSLKWFDGKSFIARIGIEEGSGNFPDKNVLAGVITPDKKDWHLVEQPPPFNGGGGSAAPASSTPTAAPVERPGWAS